MGQYYKTVNIDNNELLHPHKFGDGLKLMEFGASSNGTLTALATLLEMSSVRRGPWAGSRVVVTGDYADEGLFVPEGFESINLYTYVALLGKPAEDDDTDTFKQLAAKLSELPPAKELERDELNEMLAARGTELRLRESLRFTQRTGPTYVAALDLARTEPYNTFEEVVEAFGLQTSETLLTCVEEIFRELRMNGIQSQVAWYTLYQATLVVDDDETQHAVHIVVEPREGNGDRKSTRSLPLPASVAALRHWLGVS